MAPFSTIAMNVGSPSANYALRQQEIASVGLRLTRATMEVGESSLVSGMDYARDHGRRVFVLITNFGDIKGWWDRHGTHGGFCGVLELGNESYLSSGVPNFTGNPTGYWDALHSSTSALKAAYPSAKVLCQASVEQNTGWVDAIINHAGAAEIRRIIYGWSIHPYSVGRDPTGTSRPATQWQLNQMNSKLSAAGLGGMPLWATEWGFSVASSTYNVVPTRAIQNDYINKSYTIFGNPANNVQVSALYELTTEPGASPEEANFGITGHDSDTHLDPTWTTVHNLIVANNNAGAQIDFHGAVTPPPPPTPTAPSVTTSSPSGVSAAGGASLFAQVNPNQLSTTVVFDEGPTTAYGNHLAATPNPIPAGTSPVQAQASLAGPLPAGTRHVRASATNTQGTTVGNDVAYTVPSGAVPLQVQITLGSPTSQVNLVSSSIDPTVTQVRFASTAANDANAPTYQNFSSPFPATFTPPLGQPWVNVSAYDASGAQVGVWQDAVAGRSRIQTTAAAGVAPTVTTVAATQITASGATLNGTANLNGQTSGQATIQYGATTGYGSTAGPVTVTGTAGSSGSITFDAAHSGSVAPGTSIPVAATGANGSFQLGIFGGKGTGATQPNLTAPSTSWSRFLTHAFSSTAGGAHLLGLYSKVAASEGTTTWVSDQNQNQAVVVFAAAGVAATSSIRSSASFFNDASNTCQCPSVSAVAGDVLLYGGQFTNGDTATFPAGATNVTQVTTGAGVADVTVFVGMETIATTGLTGIRQITLNNTYGNGADPSVGFSVVVAPSGTATGVPFSIPVTGVPASTLRHYKAFVTTAGGTSSGSDLSFTTLSAGGSLPGVTWSTPTCVSAQGVSFAGNVDAGSQSTDWKFQYRAKGDTAWTDGPGGNTTVTKLVSGTVSPGLAFSTLYEAQLTATNATGTVTTTVHTFTTSASGHHKFAVGDNVYVLDVSTPGAPDSLLGQTGQVDLCTTTLVTVSFATGEVVAFAPWALRSPP